MLSCAVRSTVATVVCMHYLYSPIPVQYYSQECYVIVINVIRYAVVAYLQSIHFYSVRDSARAVSSILYLVSCILYLVSKLANTRHPPLPCLITDVVTDLEQIQDEIFWGVGGPDRGKNMSYIYYIYVLYAKICPICKASLSSGYPLAQFIAACSRKPKTHYYVMYQHSSSNF